ncbi:hypothetical protein [Pontivivens ytuae]|uniref:Uncharacterized protein n=1 Tax=Pontivivens ytuae TaxID=2789856 RepID=A0A7S9LS20_9RHOB|nr:hypothetical protein [Pontivivens ytuae]QPH54256.1 hypothetical protein I0K15_00310 [Pontivivens ytuae]
MTDNRKQGGGFWSGSKNSFWLELFLTFPFLIWLVLSAGIGIGVWIFMEAEIAFGVFIFVGFVVPAIFKFLLSLG